MIKKLIDEIIKKDAPIVAGLDPMLSFIPEYLKKRSFEEYGQTLEGVADLLKTVNDIKKGINPKLKLLGVLATMYDKRTSLSSQVLAEVKRYFKDKVFDVTIPRNVRLAEAPSHGVAIGQYDRFSKGAKSYKALAEEVMERVK